MRGAAFTLGVDTGKALLLAHERCLLWQNSIVAAITHVFLLKFYNWCKYTDLCCLLVRYSNVFLNNIEIFFSTEVYGGPEVVGFPVLTVFGFSSHMVMSSKGWGGRRRHGGVTDASACQ